MRQVSSFLNLHLATFKILRSLKELLLGWQLLNRQGSLQAVCLWVLGISPFKHTVWVNSETRMQDSKVLVEQSRKTDMFSYTFIHSCPCSYQLYLRLRLELYRDLYTRNWETNGSESKVILNSPAQIKKILRHTDKCTPRKWSQHSRAPQGCIDRLPRAGPKVQAANIRPCGQILCPKSYPRMKKHYSYKAVRQLGYPE